MAGHVFTFKWLEHCKIRPKYFGENILKARHPKIRHRYWIIVNVDRDKGVITVKHTWWAVFVGLYYEMWELLNK